MTDQSTSQSNGMTCALRALNLEDDQADGCVALPCLCAIELEQDRIDEYSGPSLRQIDRWLSAGLLTYDEAVRLGRERMDPATRRR